MGQSTNAILAFGFDLGDSENLPQGLYNKLAEYDNDTEALIAAELNLPPMDYTSLRAAIDKFPVEFITHCSGDYPMYFLAVRGTKQVALRGSPTDIVYGHVHDVEIKALKDFCHRHDIAWQEPKWYIFSYWG